MVWTGLRELWSEVDRGFGNVRFGPFSVDDLLAGIGIDPAGAPVAAPRPPAPHDRLPRARLIRLMCKGRPRRSTRGPGSTTSGDPCAIASHISARASPFSIVLVTAVALALVGTTVGYAALNKEVTLSVDGQTRTVESMGSTVGDVLESQDIELGEHDQVAPGLDEKVEDGSAISVRYGRPLELEVDGSARTYWVTSTDVESALAEIGRRFSGADLSASRSADIDRGGMSLTVVTPKTLTIKVGNAQDRQEGGRRAHRPPRPPQARRRRRQERHRQAVARSRRSTRATRSSSPRCASRRRGSTARPSTSTPSSARTPRCTTARPARSAPASPVRAT